MSDNLVFLAYLVSAFLFVAGIKRLSSPKTARTGNAYAAAGMLLAIFAALIEADALDWTTVAVMFVVGATIGAWLARSVKMTAMPQLVAVFNGFGGGASAAVAGAELLSRSGAGGVGELSVLTIALGTLIGTVTFSGSFVAFGKLQGFVASKPVAFPLQKTLNGLIFLAALAIAGDLVAGGALLGGAGEEVRLLAILALLAFVLGILLVIPIGGADMPVVVSLLNSYSGIAAAATGFVLQNQALIIAGALVGASGLILTRIMCKAMNRSLANVAFGTFGGPAAGVSGKAGAKPVRSIDAEQAAMVLAYAKSVAVVPGYGLAVAQAQHELKKICDILEERGVRVRFGVHPVAGRMPGHMNVLLAEADVSYDLLLDLDEINSEFPSTDVALVVGANDVVNPAARDPNSVIAGMPILDVDRAKSVIVMKRSLSPGFAGIDNELFYLERSMMFFGDAKQSMVDLAREVREA